MDATSSRNQKKSENKLMAHFVCLKVKQVMRRVHLELTK